MTLKTTTVIGTVLTASAHHGTGTDIILLGTHGVTARGDIMIPTIMEDGTTAAGTTHGTEDGMTHGITEAIGITIITIADGTEDGTHIGATITTVRDTADLRDTIALTSITATGIKPVLTG